MEVECDVYQRDFFGKKKRNKDCVSLRNSLVLGGSKIVSSPKNQIKK